MKKALIQTFLETRRQDLSASAETRSQLDLLCHDAPEFCLKALGDAGTHVSQKAQLLAGLVRSKVTRQQIAEQLRTLPDGELLHVLDGLRLRRINGRRVRLLGLFVLVGHTRFAELAAHHRLRLVKIFKHLLGERTWSAVRRFLEVASPEGEQFLQQNLLRFASDSNTARESLCFLAGLGLDQAQPESKSWSVMRWLQKPETKPFAYTNELLRQSAAARRDLNAGRGMPRATLSGVRGTYHAKIPRRILRELAAPVTRRERVDGAVTAAIKQALLNGQETSLEALVSQVINENLSVVDTHVAVVMDLSGSMASSGERLNHPAALGLALVALLQQHVRELKVFQVGGSSILNGHGIPQPAGTTDLARAILDAARTEPEAILIVTDGYENFRQGDVAQAVAGLRRIGRTAHVEQVTPVIAMGEDLSRRRLAQEIPLVRCEHESGAGELAVRMLMVRQPDELDMERLPVVEQLLFGV